MDGPATDSIQGLKSMPRARPILGFPTEDGRFVLDTDASLFAVGGVLSQLQEKGEVVIAYASRSLRLTQRRYCTTRREILAAVVMCTHFRSYLQGAQFTLRTDHSSPLTPEIPERRRDASPLVFAIRPILSYIRISSGVTAYGLRYLRQEVLRRFQC